jgi:exosortase/archaeosortase family protein
VISGFRFQVSDFREKLWLLPLAWLWFVLINDLRVEWEVNPQYSYGWAVPFLCAFLLWQRCQRTDGGGRTADGGGRRAEIHPPSSVLCLLALLYAPTRLIEEANPGWRLVSWALALEVVGLTLIFIHLALRAFPLRYVRGEGQGEVSSPSPFSAFQRFSFSDFVFPICFFLVAVPWPTLIEQSLIQGLTRADTGMTTELLGWIGIPAMPHGNVIEVATGMVGIDEACSGIRSFQATLMISLFLGEFYRLSVFRRSVLCLSGFALSFLFNLGRMSLLVWVAARKGVPAIAAWHDPAGVTILVACFVCLWGMGVLLKGKTETLKTEKLKIETPRIEAVKAAGAGPGGKHFSISAFQFSAFALCGWILLTEFSVEAWYGWHEARVPAAPQWTVAWPTNNPAFKELPIAPVTRQILRYDEGRSAGWQEGGWDWQAVYLRWKPGRTAIHLAQNHTPEVCMTAAGYTLHSVSPQEWFEADGLRMPFSVNEVTGAPRPFYVFYCLWDDRAGAQGFETMSLTYGRRLAPVLAGLRNPGQRSLEIAVAGPDNADEAGAALRAELEKLIVSKR